MQGCEQRYDILCFKGVPLAMGLRLEGWEQRWKQGDWWGPHRHDGGGTRRGREAVGSGSHCNQVNSLSSLSEHGVQENKRDKGDSKCLAGAPGRLE